MKLPLAFIVALSFYALVFSKAPPFEPSCGMTAHDVIFYKVIDGYNCSTKPQQINTCTGKCKSHIYPKMVEERPPAHESSFKELFSQDCQCCGPDGNKSLVHQKSLDYNCMDNEGKKYITTYTTTLPNLENCICQPCKERR